MMNKLNKRIAAALALSAMLGAPLALAQSHSVTNMANPPQGGSDSKAATAATPGHTATADQQDNKHPNKGAKDAKANKAKGKTAGEKKGGTKAMVKPDPDISKAQAGNETKETLQRDPSETQVSEIEQRALSTAPGKK
jgi:hypothetical protein